jgi:hypothetical protein
MSNIGPSTTVYIFFHDPRYDRVWLASYEIVRNRLGDLIMKPELDADPRCAMSCRYEMAIIIKRRLETEGYLNPSIYEAHFSLTPTGDEVAAGNNTSAPDKDGRVIMQYRGLLVRPGHDVNHGRCWFVKFPGQGIESIRGNSPEEAVDKVFERNLQDKAEKYDAPPPEPQAPPAQNPHNGYRLRPGSLR